MASTLNETLDHLGSKLLWVMKIIGLEHMAVVNDTWIRAYSAPFPGFHRPPPPDARPRPDLLLPCRPWTRTNST